MEIPSLGCSRTMALRFSLEGGAWKANIVFLGMQGFGVRWA